MKISQTRIRNGQFGTNLLEAGRKGTPILFLIHDGALGAGSLVSWEGVIAELQSDFHIFAIDLYGFGQSDMLFHFGLRPYQSHIEQIAQVARDLKLRDVHFVGTSYGGSVLIRAAAEERSPWPMRSGTSIGGAGGLFRHEEGRRQLAAIEPTPESIRNCLRLLASEAWPGFENNAEGRFQNSIRPGHWEALNAPRLRSPLRADSSDSFPASLSRCRLPLLLIEGTKDKLLEPGWARKMAEHAPTAEVITLDAGHSPNLDQPGRVGEELRKFVERQETASARALSSACAQTR